MMKAELSYKNLKKMTPKLKLALQSAHRDLAHETWGNLIEYSPVDTGRLSSSWKISMRGNMRTIISTNVKYALVQSEGSDPYMIYPRQAKALRFQVGGEFIFAKSVLHPGIQGTKYIDGAIASAENRVDEFIEKALREEGLI